MATLYTPEAKTTGLDWLAGMVQNGQQLWQRERSLQQEAQRLQVAKQQQALQSQQFWATQARLKEQEDFQNRKFLYGMKNDERNFAWNQSQADRNYNLQARQEDRLTAAQVYAQNPNSLPNKYMAANTEAAQARAEQDRKETELKGADPWSGIPFSPGAEPPVKGETTQPWHAPMQLPPGQPASGANILPDLGVNKWRAPLQRPEQQPGISAMGGQLTPDTTKPDGVWGPGKVVGSWRTGDPMNPVAGVDPLGNPYSITVAGTSADGQKFYQRQTLPRVKEPAPKTWEQDRNMLSDNVTALTGKLKQVPSYPRAAKGDELSAEQKSAYQDQLRMVKESNKLVQQQIDAEKSRIAFGDAREQMSKTPPPVLEPTPKFASIAPLWQEAVSRRDPVALENLRLQVSPLAADGDPAAIKALAYIDKIGSAKGALPQAGRTPVTGSSYYHASKVPE